MKLEFIGEDDKILFKAQEVMARDISNNLSEIKLDLDQMTMTNTKILKMKIKRLFDVKMARVAITVHFQKQKNLKSQNVHHLQNHNLFCCKFN